MISPSELRAHVMARIAPRLYGGSRRSRPEEVDEAPPSRADSLREIVLRHVGQLEPRHSAEIHRRVLADYGEVTQRSVLRALRYLREAGRIVRGPDGYLRARQR